MRDFADLPERLMPYIVMRMFNEPIPIASGPLKMVAGGQVGTIDGGLVFRWLPSTAVEFGGACSVPSGLDADVTIESSGALAFSVAASITNTTLGTSSSDIRGVLRQELTLGEDRFERLRFCLVNFPEYIGAPVRLQNAGGSSGFARARLEVRTDLGICCVDAISDVNELRQRLKRDPGFVISHVGEWIPGSGSVTVPDAGEVIRMLHFWFGFLRGAWAGPVFPEGMIGSQVAWRQFAAWKIRESKPATTWLPEVTPVDLTALFAGFTSRWSDAGWQGPLIQAISWFVEANSPRTSLESRIVLAQVALDLLAWVHLVETQRLHSRGDFKRISAAGRIRALLHQAGIPTPIPDYLTLLPSLRQGDAFDGPGIITAVRNALVHATEENRVKTGALTGPHLLQCSQLSLHYVELALLAICGHTGHYARRGCQGWKGNDEVLVPWAA